MKNTLMNKTKYLVFIAELAVLLCLAAAFGCTTPKETTGVRAVLELVPESEWPVMYDDMDAESLDNACQKSMEYLKRVPPEREFAFGSQVRTAEEMKRGIERLRTILISQPDPIERTHTLKKEFLLFRSTGSDNEGKVLFTGYYEPILEGTKLLKAPFLYPLFGLPGDLVTVDLKDFGITSDKRRIVGRVDGRKLVPYYDREAIDYENAIEGKADPLAYVSDPVEAFFLHIQGSGQISFSDGTRLRLGYAGVNGHPYRSIGQYLIQENLMTLDNMSMQAIKKFLEENQELRRKVLSRNPSYVFFRPLPAVDGPLGCFNIPLTGGRSIATDRKLFPGLAPVYIVGRTPVMGGGTAPLARFALNQDTGGAIRGPGRLDLFYGSGYEAGELAGRMKYEGRLYFLAPRRQ